MARQNAGIVFGVQQVPAAGGTGTDPYRQFSITTESTGVAVWIVSTIVVTRAPSEVNTGITASAAAAESQSAANILSAVLQCAWAL